MGRGRAKAKQTKVARALKYHSPDTDLTALQRELGGRATSGDPDDNGQYDEYGDEVDDAEDDDADSEDETDDGRWATRRS